jgi:CBS domain-containing protein
MRFMGQVKNILKTKGSGIYSISPYMFVYDALDLMLQKNVGALLVTENDKLLGVFTERDYVRKVRLQGKDSSKTLIMEIMTTELFPVSSETAIETCMQTMTNHYIRHLPVIDGNELVGIISLGDVVKFIIDEQKFIIENLEHYITGT